MEKTTRLVNDLLSVYGLEETKQNRKLYGDELYRVFNKKMQAAVDEIMNGTSTMEPTGIIAASMEGDRSNESN
jgi:hypothetical protein